MSSTRRAFVTGGNGSLGSAVCRALVAAGYETHASTHSSESSIGLGPGGFPVPVESRNASSSIAASYSPGFDVNLRQVVNQV